jgi:hypothetical protein
MHEIQKEIEREVIDAVYALERRDLVELAHLLEQPGFAPRLSARLTKCFSGCIYAAIAAMDGDGRIELTLGLGTWSNRELAEALAGVGFLADNSLSELQAGFAQCLWQAISWEAALRLGWKDLASGN